MEKSLLTLSFPGQGMFVPWVTWLYEDFNDMRPWRQDYIYEFEYELSAQVLTEYR